jgi:hypothetical protein
MCGCCERGIRGGSEGSRRTRAHDLDLCRVAWAWTDGFELIGWL